MRKLKTKAKTFNPQLLRKIDAYWRAANYCTCAGSRKKARPQPIRHLVVMNDMDRFHLVADVIDRVPVPGPRAAYAKQAIRDKLIEYKQYIARHGQDLPEIRNWKWSAGSRKGSASCHG
jgi:phosphoketolase